MKRRTLTISLAVLGLAAVASAVWFLTGDDRNVSVTFWIWATPLVLAGFAVAAVLLAGWSSSRTRSALAAANEEAAEESRRAHRTFVSRLDHELKNPVTALRMGLTQVGDPALAESMGAQVERLSTLVTDLRKITEIEDYPIANEEVDLRDIVDEVVDVAGTEDREIEVNFPRAPRPVPPVRGDRDLIYLAVHNVVANAVKYSEAGATIEIRGREEHDRGVLEVADTGRGIAAADQPMVWEELARGADVRHIPGSGLGLPMVASVVRRLGGRVDLTSIEGRGTTVRIELPLA